MTFGPGISIHALLAESDARHGDLHRHRRHFYPRSPCGERRYSQRSSVQEGVISIHALLAESDFLCGETMGYRRLISIHALLAESDERRGNRNDR